MSLYVHHKPECVWKRGKSKLIFSFFLFEMKKFGWKKEMEVENEAKKNARDGVDGSSARSILD